MSSNNFLDLLHQGFRITVGAATSLVETLQNTQKREETFSDLQTELHQRTQEWAEKGEVTEKAAQQVVSDLISQQQGSSAGTSTATQTTATATNTYVQIELQELTAQIVALRTELEQIREAKE